MTIAEHILKVRDCIKHTLKGSTELLISMRDSLPIEKGRYLRAHMCLSFGLGGGSKNENAVLLASAIELVHLASLLQDDVFDSEEYRRELPTFQKQWGKTVSVLYSDILFSKATAMLLPLKRMDILDVILAAVRHMCAGEILHKFKNNEMLTVDEYLDIVGKKTASLFAVSCETGAMLVSPCKEYTDAAYSFGRDFGMAYQLIDDCFDLEESDLKNRIMTLPRILDDLSCAQTIDFALRYIDRAENALDTVMRDMSATSLHELRKRIVWMREKTEEVRAYRAAREVCC